MISTEIAGDAKSVIEMLFLLDSTYQIDCKQTCHGSTHILTCQWFSSYMVIEIALDDQAKIVNLKYLGQKGCEGLDHVRMQAVHTF